jgi:hypothetical protein
MHFTGTTVLKLINGKIVEKIGLDDGVTALMQLGLIKTAWERSFIAAPECGGGSPFTLFLSPHGLMNLKARIGVRETRFGATMNVGEVDNDDRDARKDPKTRASVPVRGSSMGAHYCARQDS